MRQNPYASPAYNPAEPAALADPQHQTRPLRALGRWTLICSVSAAPSFFWGCGLHHGFQHIVAMLAGILVFVLAYTAVECTRYYHQIISLPHVHLTALIGYGTRILISLIFPIGLTIDMFTGIISVSLVDSLLGSGTRLESTAPVSAVSVFLTTVVQGVLLNLMLLAYMFIVYAGLRVLSVVRGRMRRPEEAVV